MSPLSRFLKKISILFARNRFRGELDEEMVFHREQAEKEYIAAGMTPEAARHAAMRQFGNATRLKEQSHEVVGFNLETVVQDLRFALRQLRKNPGFALTAILILALGIGSSLAIFAFVDAALIKPLPYADPTRLAVLFESIALGPRFHRAQRALESGACRRSLSQAAEPTCPDGVSVRPGKHLPPDRA